MLKTIIIDHDRSVREAVSNLIDRCCPNLLLIAEAESPESATRIIRESKPDLVFLNMDTQQGNGLEALQEFSPLEFKIIFLTDWDRLTIKPFRLSCLDYLDRPPEAEELKAAVLKAKKTAQEEFNIQLNILSEHLMSREGTGKKIIIPSAGSMQSVNISDIEYMRSEGNFTQLHLSGGQNILASNTLIEYEEMLGDFGFVRMEQHYLVSGGRR